MKFNLGPFPHVPFFESANTIFVAWPIHRRFQQEQAYISSESEVFPNTLRYIITCALSIRDFQNAIARRKILQVFFCQFLFESNN